MCEWKSVIVLSPVSESNDTPTINLIQAVVVQCKEEATLYK